MARGRSRSGSWGTSFDVTVDFEAKGGVFLDDIQVSGYATLCRDGFDYEYGSIHGYHDLGVGIEDIQDVEILCYSERRKDWVKVSNRLADAIYQKNEDYITQKIMEQSEQDDRYEGC